MFQIEYKILLHNSNVDMDGEIRVEVTAHTADLHFPKFALKRNDPL